jgi:hypothetical protein
MEDITYAIRGLRKNAGFTLIVVLTLAFGIGANAAIFSLLDQVVLRRLPVRAPSELVFLDGPGAFRGRTFNAMTFSYPMYTDLRDRDEVFTGVLTRFPTAMTVVWNGRSEVLDEGRPRTSKSSASSRTSVPRSSTRSRVDSFTFPTSRTKT